MKSIPLKTTVANVNHCILRQFGLEDFRVSSLLPAFVWRSTGSRSEDVKPSVRPTLKPFGNTLEHCQYHSKNWNPKQKTVWSVWLFLKGNSKQVLGVGPVKLHVSHVSLLATPRLLRSSCPGHVAIHVVGIWRRPTRQSQEDTQRCRTCVQMSSPNYRIILPFQCRSGRAICQQLECILFET